MLLAYGTDTGTALSFAEKLLFRWRRAPVHLVDLADLDAVTKSEIYPPPSSAASAQAAKVVVFIIATSGEGELPSSVKPLWTAMLKASLPRDLYAGKMDYAIFGLGDSSYERFNAAARKLRARLAQLGAREICKAGAGDDQVDSEMLFDRWVSDTLQPALVDLPSLDDQVRKVLLQRTSSELALDDEKYIVTLSEATTTNSAPPPTPECTSFTVVQNTRLTSETWSQDVRQLDLSSSNSDAYQTGDVLYLFPRTDEQVALRVLRAKFPGLNPQAVVTVTGADHPATGHTVLDCLTSVVDLSAMPNRQFFLQLSCLTSDEEERDRLREFADSSAEFASQYLVYCKRERRTVVEVLLDFASVNLSFARLLELAPRIKPRAFSIASSPVVHPNTIQLCIALVKYLTPHKRLKHGTCSQFVQSAHCKVGQRVFGYVRRGALALPPPQTPSPPLVMVATGTGCAPMRSLVQAGAAQARLYLGHRSGQDDVLYKDWNDYGDVKVCLALSKGTPPCRVTQLLARDGEVLYRLLVEQRGYLYVSGSAKQMPADVRETLVQQFMKHGGDDLSREDAVKLLRQMERERRYIVDAWS